ncbi:MAG TPA: hypothetical protein PLF31_03180 [Candidatus Paceibacterota bacterium]|nr:hypothetical protein [Candidatus Paceibacterota bacterium]
MEDTKINQMPELPGAVIINEHVHVDASPEGEAFPGYTPPQPIAPPPQKKKTVTKLLGLIALLVFLIGIMVLTVIFVPRIAKLLSDRMDDSNEGIATVTSDRSRIQSGDIVLISWDGPVRLEGAYTISYPCKAGISATFHSGEEMVCEEPFFFSSTDNTVAVRLASTNTGNVDVPLYINYKDIEENTSIIGDAIIAVEGTGTSNGGFLGSLFGNNGSTNTNEPTEEEPVNEEPVYEEPETPTEETPVEPTPTTPRPTTPTQTSSPADLQVYLLETGYLDGNNVFIRNQNIPSGRMAALRFVVTNGGGRLSGPWSFSASLPSDTDPTYTSPVQTSLAPTSRVEFTLGYSPRANGGTAVIAVNADRSVTESNYGNNVLQVNQ